MVGGGYKHYPHQGFQKGHPPFKGCEKGQFKKGHIPFIKGKKGYYKHSDEFKRRMSERNKGSKNFFWKGGITKHSQGYILIHQPSHPRANKGGYVKRSYLVMEQIIGRYLNPQEIVHHRGIKYPLGSIENKQDDRPENLQLFANGLAHKKFHARFQDYKIGRNKKRGDNSKV